MSAQHGGDAFNQAVALHQQGQWDAAESAYRAVLASTPEHADAHNNLALLLKKRGQFEEAESAYKRAIALRPDAVESLNNLAVLYLETNRLEEGEACFKQALKLRPEYFEAWNNLGNLLQGMRRYDDALMAYRKVLEGAAQKIPALQVQASEASARGDMPLANRHQREARALRSTLAEARWNLGLLHLLKGEYAAGWPLHESRFDPFRFTPVAVPPDLQCPPWQGQSLEGKSILVWFEQGYGDEIQFARYLPWLKEKGASKVTLVCKAPLLPLMQSIAEVDEVLPAEGKLVLPRPDYWVLPMSLAFRHGTTLESIPARLPYLRATLERLDAWANVLPKRSKNRNQKIVGLVWAGSASHRNDRNRSLPSLDLLAPLWAIDGVTFISLQTGPRADEAQRLGGRSPLMVLDKPIQDFADTAAIIKQLDLVITVDTAVAHVAGALDKPCWVLLPWMGTDWRWLLEREDCPWYPGALRLFRQTSLGDWAGVIQRVAAALDPGRPAPKSTKRKRK
ncbi:MAG: hypothetical protein RIR70_1703 [Pseudomonadota bacterium]|jgi:Flp pilus assembly protein TadD